VISQGLTLVSSIVTARLLGSTGFGEYGMINSTVGMFGTFAGFGLGLTTTKFVAELRTSDPERAGRIIGLTSIVAALSGGLISLGLFLFAPLLATHTLAAPQLVSELRMSSLLLFFNALIGVQTGTLAGFEAFRTIAKLSLAKGLLSFPLMIAGVLTWRLPGAVLGLVAASFIGWLINNLILRKKSRDAGIRATYVGVWREGRVLWSFAFPAFLANASVGPVTWMVNALLINRPRGYSEMGVFNAAYQWRTAMIFLPTLIGQVVMPMLSSLQGEKGRQSARKILLGATLLNALFVLPALLPILFLSNRIMAFYGPGFASRGMVLLVTALTAGLYAIETPVGDIIAASGRMWLAALINLGWACVFVGSAWFFLRIGWGADGLAAAYLIAYSVHATWTFWLARRIVVDGYTRRIPL
jgi:O-antigen/teichoic acid export membrane protein